MPDPDPGVPPRPADDRAGPAGDPLPAAGDPATDEDAGLPDTAGLTAAVPGAVDLAAPAPADPPAAPGAVDPAAPAPADPAAAPGAGDPAPLPDTAGLTAAVPGAADPAAPAPADAAPPADAPAGEAFAGSPSGDDTRGSQSAPPAGLQAGRNATVDTGEGGGEDAAEPQPPAPVAVDSIPTAVQPAAAGVAPVPEGADPVPAQPEVPVEPAAPTGSAPTAASTPRRFVPSRLAALAAVLVITLALAAVAGLLVQRSRDAAAVEDYYRPTSAPLEAARTAAAVLFSYDHRTLDADFAEGAALSTGAFRAEYARTTARVVREVATEYKAVVVAEPVVAGIAQAERGEVVVVVFVNQSTQSTRVQGTKVDQSRVRMTLLERDGRWLVSRVEAL